METNERKSVSGAIRRDIASDLAACPASLRSDATALALTLLAAVLVVAALVVRECVR